MTFVKVTSDIAEGEKKGLKAKNKEILVVNLDGNCYALNDKCTHLGCKLSDGSISGGNIVCPCHGSTFEIKTGKVVKGPAQKPLKSFKVKRDGKDILVDL
jgi:nitrite reductase/ring-hydroxylating ferredoxin subunit